MPLNSSRKPSEMSLHLTEYVNMPTMLTGHIFSLSVLIGFGGGESSTALLHLCSQGLEDANKRLLFSSSVIVVDEGVGKEDGDRKKSVSDAVAAAKRFPFPVFVAPLEAAASDTFPAKEGEILLLDLSLIVCLNVNYVSDCSCCSSFGGRRLRVLPSRRRPEQDGEGHVVGREGFDGQGGLGKAPEAEVVGRGGQGDGNHQGLNGFFFSVCTTGI